jgi:hypothetical protein
MRRPLGLALTLLLSVPVIHLLADEPAKPQPKSRPTFEARFIDGSSLKLALRDEAIDIASPYGRLRVPVAEIRRMELATRTPAEIAERIAVCIGDLGNPQFSVRDAATNELAKMRERAYHALLVAAKDKDAETAKRASELLERIRSEVPPDQLEFQPFDVVTTAHSKIAGRIEAASLGAETMQFGDVRLKLTDLRSLRNGADSEPTTIASIEDPGSLTNYQSKFGTVLAIRVTGNAAGSVWGSDVYTCDSTLATAAVHAGILKVGQTGVVRVKIVPSPMAYQGSTRHGVTSSSYGSFSAAYEFVRRSGDD